MKVVLYNQNKEELKKIDLDDSVFGVTINEPLVHRVIKSFLVNTRSGNANTKDRSQIAGSTRKIYKQKGTGSARHGSKKSPIYVGGGTAFGPKTKDFEHKINKKEYKASVRSILSDKLNSGELFVLNNLDVDAKTKNIAAIMAKFSLEKCLFVDEENENLYLASRNIYKVLYTDVNHLRPYDLLKYNNLVITESSVANIVKRYKN